MQCVTRKWGNGIGILLPKEFTKKNNIQPNQKIDLPDSIIRIDDLSDIFGSVKTNKSTDQIMKEIDEGWD